MPVLPEKKKEKDEKRIPETRLDGDKDWPIKFGLILQLEEWKA